MREAGWYWVKWGHGSWHPEYSYADDGFISEAYGNPPDKIGPKINEPEELG